MSSQMQSSCGKQEVSVHLTRSIPTKRFPSGLWTLLILPYLPIGTVLCLLRVCLSIQAILILLIVPQGAVKRWMLRVFFAVLGILVTTDGKTRDTKLIISNKLSFVDHIVLHLACKSVSVSTGGQVPPLAPLFPHWTFPASDDEALLEAAKALPEFTDTVVDFSPYSVQPEPLPTNGRHLLLKFSEWPFFLESSIQPVALSVFRPFPIAVSTVHSSGWWDLFWMFFTPITVFHARFLQVVQPELAESAAGFTGFTGRVRESLVSALQLQSTQLAESDVQKWLAGPPRPKAVPRGPILAPSEFDPAGSDSQLDTMVHQVTAVLPHIPYTVIRKDLLSTNSVDATITNLLEGRVESSPASSSKGTSAAQVFRRRVASSQCQLSLEERKRELLQSARRKYMENHGP